jgi:prepilin-type N-terminal cleavage/methylation domain-containing protein
MKRMERQGRRGLDRRRSGYTLTELILVMVVCSVMATMAVPSIVSSQKKMRIDAAVQQLTIDLARARSEAMSRNQSVTVTRPSATGYTVPFVGDRKLEGDITFTSGSAATIRFTSYGAVEPAATHTMVLQLLGQTRTVSVSAAGFTSVR